MGPSGRLDCLGPQLCAAGGEVSEVMHALERRLSSRGNLRKGSATRD